VGGKERTAIKSEIGEEEREAVVPKRKKEGPTFNPFYSGGGLADPKARISA